MQVELEDVEGSEVVEKSEIVEKSEDGFGHGHVVYGYVDYDDCVPSSSVRSSVNLR